MPTKENALKRLDEISHYSQNWNGYGAEPFEKSLIDKCKYMVERMSYVPEVFPTARVSIQFEIDTEHFYLELEVSASSYNFFIVADNGNQNEFVLSDVDETVKVWDTLMMLIKTSHEE